MTVSIKNTVLVLKGFLEASGRFADVAVGDYFKAPQSLSATVILTGTTVPETTLTAPVEERTVTIRVYADAMAEPREDTEFLLDDVMGELLTAVCNDYDLGGDVRSIDATKITVRYGFATVDQKIYRIADMAIPMIMDDSASFTV